MKYQRLTCLRCGKRWQRERARGGRPMRCPECRGLNEPAEYLGVPRDIEDRYIILGPLPCRTCGTPVYYGEAGNETNRAIRDLDGWRHDCALAAIA